MTSPCVVAPFLLWLCGDSLLPGTTTPELKDTPSSMGNRRLEVSLYVLLERLWG